jgi:hypothetical protein
MNRTASHHTTSGYENVLARYRVPLFDKNASIATQILFDLGCGYWSFGRMYVARRRSAGFRCPASSICLRVSRTHSVGNRSQSVAG